jgi:hypothetical protein
LYLNLRRKCDAHGCISEQPDNSDSSYPIRIFHLSDKHTGAERVCCHFLRAVEQVGYDTFQLFSAEGIGKSTARGTPVESVLLTLSN